jgi:NitT/TauT family transport system ATP-binding protein
MSIVFHEISKRFRARGRMVDALGDVSLDVARGEFVALVGPSGCGKSTLLNMAAGILAPSRGEVRYAGQRIDRVNRSVGYLTQQDSLLPWRNTEANVMLPLLLRDETRKVARIKAAAMLDRVGLAGFAQHYPSELSGGMRKRAALAQLLVYDPETLLLDEPFGALDAQLKLVLAQELARIHETSGKTIVFVTHDLAEAITLADRIVVFTARPGRVKRVERVALARPRDVFKMRFDPAFQALHESLWQELAPEIATVAA